MNHFESWNKLINKRAVTILLIVVVAISALMYFLPREKKIGFEYEINRPWRYAQLIAEYDFPIFKTEEELKHETDSLLSTFRPYFKLDTLRSNEQIHAFQKAYKAGNFPGVPPEYIPHIVKALEEIYAVGVIQSDALEKLKQADKKSMLLLKGNVASNRPVTQLYTLASAYEYLMKKEAAYNDRAYLERCQIRKFLVANVIYDKDKTEAERRELLEISMTSGMVQKGQLIIDRGQIVTPGHIKVLNSLKRENEHRMDPTKGYWLIFFGQLTFISIVFGIFLTYIKLFRKEYLRTMQSMLLLMILVTIFPILTYIMMSNLIASVYLLPYATIPIFIRIFYDSRTALVALIASALMSSIVLYGPFEFILLQIITGMTAIYSLREMTERSQVLKTAAEVTVVGLLIIIAYDLSQGMNLEALDETRGIHIFLSGILLLFCYPLMYVVERLFGFTSSVTLVELTNINSPILRRMSKVAQGTFNHSMQVANLASEVADKIGAKPQLVRTGALYHDIGKMLNPAFFTENQNGVNPHDNLTEEKSAAIIIDHVVEGVKLAEKYHLPPVIRDFITTHHGKGMTKYFYIQYANKHPEEEIDQSMFTYPGPNPFTREQAILMMCDSVEAASRSLKEYTEESISNLVNKIIDSQLADGCFKECPLTFRDIADAKRVLIDSLKTVYHTRISYPELKNPKDKAKTPEHNSPFGSGRFRYHK